MGGLQRKVGILAVLVSVAISACSAGDDGNKNPVVTLSTTLGDIKIELYREEAPISVENFLAYANSNFYDGTIFHRVIPDFVIQGGGLDVTMKAKQTRDPIKNEATNGLKNARGTVSMARTSAVDSATSQFYINLKDNHTLDQRDETEEGYGYAVFGRVIDGMDVVDKIAQVPTSTKSNFPNAPAEPVVVTSVKVAGS
jgi:cyclophilin family peptidyl-prolyl cis-trans isomerase